MNSLAFATIRDLRSKLDSKEVSAAELRAFYRSRFETFDSELHSAIEVFDEKESDSSQLGSGILNGIPGLIKDNICINGKQATCASKILEHFTAPYNATAIERLAQEGACFIGRANMDEFAMGSSTETSAYAKTRNPWDTSRVPGGSSGGSAAAVAAGLVPWALGSETGGSVRQPAALCGVVGLKPTYGLISRYGLIAYGSSLDQIGTVTHTAYDAAILLSVMAGHDLKDSSSLAVEKKDYTRSLDGTLPPGIRIGVVENALYAHGMDPEIQQSVEDAVKKLEKLGAIVTRVSLQTLEYAAAAYFILSRAEAASNLARFDGVRYGLRSPHSKTLEDMYSHTRHDGFGAEVRTRIMVGNYVLSAGHSRDFYEKAKMVQRMIRREFIDTFRSLDVLIMPTHPMAAFKLGAFDLDKLQMDLQDYFTCPVNLAGIPAISLPCGLTKAHLPIGFQLIGPHLSEELLLRVGHAYQGVTSWHTKTPPGY